MQLLCGTIELSFFLFLSIIIIISLLLSLSCSLCVFSFQLFLRSNFTNKRLIKRRQKQAQQQQFSVEPGCRSNPYHVTNLKQKLKRRRPEKRGCVIFMFIFSLLYALTHTHIYFRCPLQFESAQTYLLMTFIKVHFHQDTIRQWAFCMAHRTITDGWIDGCLHSRYFHIVFLLCVCSKLLLLFFFSFY